jgi:rhodanese-related sulfurtransferase
MVVGAGVLKSKSLFWLVVQICMLCFFCANSFAHIDISIPDANAMINSDPNIILVDVRELSSYCGSIGHVSGALNYPWNSDYFEDHYTDFDVNDIIFLICQSGGRSNSAANFLDGKGYNYVYDILGGTSA